MTTTTPATFATFDPVAGEWNLNSETTHRVVPVVPPRQLVYEVLDGEREYQDETAKRWNHAGAPSLEADLLMMDYYVTAAKQQWMITSDKRDVLELLRKLGGVLVRSCENNIENLPRRVRMQQPPGV